MSSAPLTLAVPPPPPQAPCPHRSAPHEHGPNGCPYRPSRQHRPRESAWYGVDVESTDDRLILIVAASQAREYILANPQGITTLEALDFLTSLPQTSKKAGFFFDYDVNMILKDVPLEKMKNLVEKREDDHQSYIVWEGYKIAHIPHKQFRVKHLRSGQGCTIWDVSSWHAKSFVSLIEEWDLGTEEERQFVATMKEKRSTFDKDSLPEIIEYTKLECKFLAQYVKKILDLHEQADIKLTSFSGPGSSASALLIASGWKPPEIPLHVQELAEIAFFGGRTEISLHGLYEGPVWTYDLNSAYPSAIVDLPCLEHGEWRKARKFRDNVPGLWSVEWDWRDSAPMWGPFPYRPETGSLKYLANGSGVYHTVEVASARKLGPIKVRSGIVWEQSCDHRPFQWVEERTAQRLRLKAEGSEAALPLKLGLNSLYGKLAQRTGSHPFQSLFLAGMVTAKTRARMLDAISINPKAIVFIATDGIASIEPLDGLDIGPSIGQWEEGRKEWLFVAQAGVYFFGDEGGKIIKKSRGYEFRALSYEQVLEAWDGGAIGHTVDNIPLNRFYGYRLALHRNNPNIRCTWGTEHRSLVFDPYPRRVPILPQPFKPQPYYRSLANTREAVDDYMIFVDLLLPDEWEEEYEDDDGFDDDSLF